jgi:hypothetical protein
LPDVADEVGVADAFDPRHSIPASGGLRRPLREHFSNLGLVAAAHHAGAPEIRSPIDGVIGNPSGIYATVAVSLFGVNLSGEQQPFPSLKGVCFGCVRAL